MAQITVFVKDNCIYCKRVTALLDGMLKSIYDEIIETKVTNKEFKEVFTLKPININGEPVYAALCIRLTGSFTVPHVFFNDVYIGDATKFNCCLEKSDQVGENASVRDKCPCVYDKMMNLTLDFIKGGCKHVDFPPKPSAKMVKVTEELAFSSLPTKKQFSKLKSFGFATVINILKPISPAYDPEEKSVLEGYGLTYKHIPFYTFGEESLLRFLDNFEFELNAGLPNPILVHDDRGQIAGLIVLLISAKQMIISHLQNNEALTEQSILDMFKTWLKDLGLMYSSDEYFPTISAVLKRIFSECSQMNARRTASTTNHNTDFSAIDPVNSGPSIIS